MNIPKVFIASDIAHSIRDWFTAKEDGKKELCGVLYGHRTDDSYTVTGWAPVPNLADDPTKTFTISMSDVEKATELTGRSMEAVLGAVHTHPRGSGPDPSRQDVEECPSDLLGCVYHTTTGRLTFYNERWGFICKEDIA